MTHSALYGSRELRVGEAIVAQIRSSPLPAIGGLGIGAVLVVGDFFFLAWWFAHGGWGVLGFGVLLLVGGMVAGRSIAEWRGTRLIVTNQRVLVVRQSGLWSRSVGEAPLERIQDIRISATGVRPTLFGYGTITLELFGGSTPLHLSGIPKPESVQELIGRLQEERAPARSNPLPRPPGRVDAIRRV